MIHTEILSGDSSATEEPCASCLLITADQLRRLYKTLSMMIARKEKRKLSNDGILIETRDNSTFFSSHDWSFKLEKSPFQTLELLRNYTKRRIIINHLTTKVHNVKPWLAVGKRSSYKPNDDVTIFSERPYSWNVKLRTYCAHKKWSQKWRISVDSVISRSNHKGSNILECEALIGYRQRRSYKPNDDVTIFSERPLFLESAPVVHLESEAKNEGLRPIQ